MRRMVGDLELNLGVAIVTVAVLGCGRNQNKD